MHQFTVALASRIGHHALATRAVYLFDQAVQKGGFRFGRKARLVAGASLIIALRENKKGETVRDIAVCFCLFLLHLASQSNDDLLPFTSVPSE